MSERPMLYMLIFLLCRLVSYLSYSFQCLMLSDTVLCLDVRIIVFRSLAPCIFPSRAVFA